MTDNRSERSNYKKVHNEWQETLENKGLSYNNIAIQASKNYKVHIGKTAKELNEELEWKKPILDTFTGEQLDRHSRLEKKQIENVEPVDTSDKAVKKCKEVRDNKNWWW